MLPPIRHRDKNTPLSQVSLRMATYRPIVKMSGILRDRLDVVQLPRLVDRAARSGP